VVISLVGISLIISIIILFGLMIGTFSVSSLPGWWQDHMSTTSLPMENIRQSFPTWTAVFGFIAVFVPALFVLLIGNSILAKRIVFKPIFGWTLLVIFFISAVFLSISIPQLVYSFKEDGEFKTEKEFTIKGKPVLRVKEIGMDDYHKARIALRGHDKPNFRLVERFGAQGVTKMNARENAEQVDYNIEQTDSVLTFDSNITFKKDAKFRFQRLNMDLYIPYETPFIVEEDTWRLIDNYWSHDYNETNNPQTFKISKEGKLECLTCPAPEKDMSGISSKDQFGLKDFNEIDASGLFDVVIEQGPEYAIQLEGSPEQKKLYSLDVKSETLEVDYNTHDKAFWKNNIKDDRDLAELTITMPSLRKLKITGAGKIKIRGFDEDEMEIALTGALVGDARVASNQLSVEATGHVIFELDGHGDFLEASFSGPSQLKAGSYRVNRASIEAKGLAQARVNVSGTLEIDKDFTSNVSYSGNPEVINHD
jgi:hypothetical protein